MKSNNEPVLPISDVKWCVCMFIFLEYEVFFGGSNDQFMGLILVSFLVQTLITHPVFHLFSW